MHQSIIDFVMVFDPANWHDIYHAIIGVALYADILAVLGMMVAYYPRHTVADAYRLYQKME